jgi:hypothetical protein
MIELEEQCERQEWEIVQNEEVSADGDLADSQVNDSLNLADLGNICNQKLNIDDPDVMDEIIELATEGLKRANKEEPVSEIWLILSKAYAHLFLWEHEKALAEGYRIRKLLPRAIKKGFKLDEDPLGSMVVWCNDIINCCESTFW